MCDSLFPSLFVELGNSCSQEYLEEMKVNLFSQPDLSYFPGAMSPDSSGSLTGMAAVCSQHQLPLNKLYLKGQAGLDRSTSYKFCFCQL